MTILTYEQALQRIADLPKGEDRKKLLQDEDFRRLVLSSGANVTIYSGNIKSDKSISLEEALSGVYVGLIQRKNRSGKLDGLGALGGLAERTSEEEFYGLGQEKRTELINQRDDVVLQSNIPVLTRDINVIRQKNVLREMREELDDLGIQDLSIDPARLELISMPKVKDDNYMINIWSGTGKCFAISPYCHLYEDTEGLIDKIIAHEQEKEGGEVSSYKKIPLFKALGAYGNHGTEGCQLEDGRSADQDYRYPHEYLTVWALAAKLLNYDEDKMIALASEVQSSVSHVISFSKLAEATGQTLDDLAAVLKLMPNTIRKMEQNNQDILKQRKVMGVVFASKVPQY